MTLDDRFIKEARRRGGHKTNKQAVNAALAEYVIRLKQLHILDAFCTVSFDPAYQLKREHGRTQRR